MVSNAWESSNFCLPPKVSITVTNYLCQHYKDIYSTPSTVYKQLPELKFQIIKKNMYVRIMMVQHNYFVLTYTFITCVIPVFKNKIKNKITHQEKKERIILML
jgi:hypothetical protein